MVECGGGHFGFRAQHPNVVVIRSAPDEEDAFVAKRCQGALGGKMALRIESALFSQNIKRDPALNFVTLPWPPNL